MSALTVTGSADTAGDGAPRADRNWYRAADGSLVDRVPPGVSELAVAVGTPLDGPVRAAVEAALARTAGRPRTAAERRLSR